MIYLYFKFPARPDISILHISHLKHRLCKISSKLSAWSFLFNAVLVLVHVVIPKGLIEGLYNNIHQALPMIWLWSTGIINEVFTDFMWAFIAYIHSPIQYDEWTLKHDF